MSTASVASSAPQKLVVLPQNPVSLQPSISASPSLSSALATLAGTTTINSTNSAETAPNNASNTSATFGLLSGLQGLRPNAVKEDAKGLDSAKPTGNEIKNVLPDPVLAASSGPDQATTSTRGLDPLLSSSAGTTAAAEIKSDSGNAPADQVMQHQFDNRKATTQELLGKNTEFVDPCPTGRYSWIPADGREIPPFTLFPALVDKQRPTERKGKIDFGSGQFVNVTVPDPNSPSRTGTTKMLLVAAGFRLIQQNSSKGNRHWFLLLLKDTTAEFHFASPAHCLPAGDHCSDDVGQTVRKRLECLTAADMLKFQWMDKEIEKHHRSDSPPPPTTKPEAKRRSKRPSPDSTSTFTVRKRSKNKRGHVSKQENQDAAAANEGDVHHKKGSDSSTASQSNGVVDLPDAAPTSQLVATYMPMMGSTAQLPCKTDNYQASLPQHYPQVLPIHMMPSFVVAQTLQAMEYSDQKLALQAKEAEIVRLQQRLAEATTEMDEANSRALRSVSRLNYLVNSVTQPPP